MHMQNTANTRSGGVSDFRILHTTQVHGHCEIEEKFRVNHPAMSSTHLSFQVSNAEHCIQHTLV